MEQIVYDQLDEHRLSGWLGFTFMRIKTLADRFMFEPVGLTTASFRILMLLDKLGPQAPSQIIDLLGATKSNITQRLHLLARRGFIEMTHRAETDKRRISVRITALGLKQTAIARQLLKKHNLHIENYFTKQEVQDFLRLLRKLNVGLDQCKIELQNYYEKK